MDHHFYHEFESNFRGSREEITARLEVYLPFLRPFTDGTIDTPKLIDLGCGRGEWLELAQQNGMQAEGVDLDDGMLQDCFSRGLTAQKMDAIAFLHTLADNSLAVVSGFHIAEHLPFEVLQTLIAEAHRVLMPGGLLILETPNAENLEVGTLAFHMDPTHNKPLPPSLLSFLPRYHGFVRSKVLRLQERRTLAQAETVRLIDVFRGASPDYAVIAQKMGAPDFLAQFEALFKADYGLTLDTLSERFERGIHQQISNLDDRVSEILDYQQRLTEVYQSTSWRITKPLRRAGNLTRDAKVFADKAKSGTRVAIATTVRQLAMLVLAHPLGRKASKRVQGLFPGVSSRARSFLFSPGRSISHPSYLQDRRVSQLSPKARLLYEDLIKHLGERKNG